MDASHYDGMGPERGARPVGVPIVTMIPGDEDRLYDPKFPFRTEERPNMRTGHITVVYIPQIWRVAGYPPHHRSVKDTARTLIRDVEKWLEIAKKSLK